MNPPNPTKGGSPADNPGEAHLKAVMGQHRHNEIVGAFQEKLNAKLHLYKSRSIKRAMKEINRGNLRVINAVSDTFANGQNLGSAYFKQQIKGVE